MSGSIRQSELLQGEDWQVLYTAFTNINFNTSDPPSINLALRQYIQANYPEDFNDWIESSEFVAIIDLLSWLAGVLAFRTDIGVRENFLDTAEARSSILRLARFLSYNPQRNQAGRGLAKIVAVSTDDTVLDAFGNDLTNTTILWNDQNNLDWFEQFTLVLNDAFLPSNPFGVPLQNVAVSNIPTQLYRVNDTIGANAVFPFSTTVSGTSMNFEAVNVNFDATNGFYEQPPNAAAAFSFIYQNDGNGFASPNTGFFVLFKQGSLTSETNTISVPVENIVLDMSNNGINATDVWVQTVTDSGSVLINWTPVPAIFTDNITFNNLPPTIRNIFAVVTRDNDNISLRFSDGRFGTVPTGNIRCWYRVSNGLQYQIRPQDMQNVQITVPYLNTFGVAHNLFLTFSLQQSVSNSVPRETDEQVRRRASQVYATQNRMVSGEDYNVFPLQGNLAVKLKAVNRVYSGHSRFIDLNDPTGTYQDTNVFSDDGMIYQESFNDYQEVPAVLNYSPAQLVQLFVQPDLSRIEITDYLLNSLLQTSTTFTYPPLYWFQSASPRFGATGAFSSTSATFTPVIISSSNGDASRYIMEDSLIRLQLASGAEQWVAVQSVIGNGSVFSPTGSGPITIDDTLVGTSLLITGTIATAAKVVQIIPEIRSTLNATETANLTTRFQIGSPFLLYYDFTAQSWTDISLGSSLPSTQAILVMTVEYVSGTWRFTTNGLRYVFESLLNVQWYFDPGFSTIDTTTGLQQHDYIRVLSINPTPTNPSAGLGINYDFDLVKQYVYIDGFPEPQRIQIAFRDSNDDGLADFPDSFYLITGLLNPTLQNLLVWQKVIDQNGYETYTALQGIWVFDPTFNLSTLPSVTIPANTVAYILSGSGSLIDGSFTTWNGTSWIAITDSTAYRVNLGRGVNSPVRYNLTVLMPLAGLTFQWKHYAPSDHRIDPAQTNIIDIFMLDAGYDTAIRQWITTGAAPGGAPTTPTELQLRMEMQNFDTYKMFSDQIVWRPVTYKLLFGQAADPTLQARFKVVLLPSTTLSNGEVTSQVIAAINSYFAISNWDFGDTFYGSEMTAYVHIQLATVIASFVIVPMYAPDAFGDLYEIRCESNEIFLSVAQVSDVDIITANTAGLLRINQLN